MRDILVADPIAKSAIVSLQTLGMNVINKPTLTTEQLAENISNAEILIVRSTSVDETTIAAAINLALIVRAGADVNSIDVNAATRNGIYVANCPGRNAAAVAELVVGLLVVMDRNIIEATNDIRNGVWKKSAYAYGMGLAGNTLGILGFGATGQSLAAAGRGLGMEVIAWSRNLSPKRATNMGIGYCATAQEVARRSDVVSIHLAANSSTYHLVDRRFLQQMRDGAYLINTSRGEIVDTFALKEAIYQKSLRVALDVFEDEPLKDGNTFEDPELAQMIVATPHIAASTKQALEAISREVIRIIGIFIASGMPPNAINAPAERREPSVKNRIEYTY
jgi:D-3-phosphoglycerate dehydrogenase